MMAGITPVNDRPVIVDSTASISELSLVGALVTTVVNDDPDLQDNLSDTQTFAIIGGNDDGAFSISPVGEITLADPARLDYEVTATRELTIQVTDSGGLADTCRVTLAVQDGLEAQVESVLINDGNE